MGSRPPKVGYVVKKFPRLSETFIVNEVLELERRGTQIEIFSLAEPAQEVRHEVLQRVRAQITYLPQNSVLKKWSFRAGRYAEGTLLEQQLGELFQSARVPETSLFFLKAATMAILAQAKGVTHLHAHFATAATTVAMLAGRLAGLSYSFTAHAKDIYENIDPALLREKILGARFVITVSEYSRRHLEELAGEDLAGKILRLYNGVDLDQLHPDPSIHREPDLILGVGRLVEKKGFSYLVQACRLLQDWERPFKCFIVGDGPERASLAQQITTHGLQDRVILVGSQSQEWVLGTMKRATVLVLPCVISRTGDRDGLPTVLLEALAVGLPAISTTLVGIPEIIKHGRTGLLVPPEDPASLAKAIEEILAHPTLQERLGREGRLKAEECFDIRKNVPVLRDLLLHSASGQEGLFKPTRDEDRIHIGR